MFPFTKREKGESEERNLSDDKKEFANRLKLDEDEVNALEGATRDQASSELWRSERRFRFTASNFHLISHRKRNHQNFANTLIHPKAFTSGHTSHGIKYEPEAIHMNNRPMPVDVYKCGPVVS